MLNSFERLLLHRYIHSNCSTEIKEIDAPIKSFNKIESLPHELPAYRTTYYHDSSFFYHSARLPAVVFPIVPDVSIFKTFTHKDYFVSPALSSYNSSWSPSDILWVTGFQKQKTHLTYFSANKESFNRYSGHFHIPNHFADPFIYEHNTMYFPLAYLLIWMSNEGTW